MLFICACSTTSVLNTRTEYHKNKNKIVGEEFELLKIKTPSINDPKIVLKVIKYDMCEVTETEVVTTVTKQFAMDDIRHESYTDKPSKPQRFDNGTVLQSMIFTINANGVTRKFISNSNGEISIDLVKDCGLFETNEPIELSIEIKSDNYNYLDRINLNSKDWMVPFVRIIASELLIQNEENGKLVKKGIAYKGEVYKIEFENDELYRIKFGNEFAYITKNSAEKFWKYPQ